ncbi:MAG: pseudaminic acid biosynthesis-associated methylase [Planctomycetes bacterium]|nr:pseudaminic acid biosynthesis-associated methylase [Planctomycetota bacterium]
MEQQGFKTEQEAFWAGQFGDEYTGRNTGEAIIASNAALFAKILARTAGVRSILEFGANIGLNLLAIRKLLPQAGLSAIEINQKAIEQLKLIDGVKIHAMSVLDYRPQAQADLAFTKGLLIHINPQMLPALYKTIYDSSLRYICIAEYYNPAPVEVSYRGHAARLFKRDFAGEMLDAFADLRLVDYGFVYRRDPNFRQDDMTWFLMEKR